jgi:hypothetical protein
VPAAFVEGTPDRQVVENTIEGKRISILLPRFPVRLVKTKFARLHSDWPKERLWLLICVIASPLPRFSGRLF